MVRLFQLQFETGEVYPAYSTLRADPLGAMAFYEGLNKLPGISTRRDFSDSNRLPETPHTVYLHLAGSRYEWEFVDPDVLHEVQAFLAQGNRLVITFFPQTESYAFHGLDDPDKTNQVKSAKSKNGGVTPAKPGKKKKDPAGEVMISLEDEWGFHPGFEKLRIDGGTYTPARVANKTDLPLPPKLDWHSGLVFTNCAEAWRTIYARGTNAVVIERRFGRGSVVMATDTYFASNEAMTKDRHADLLAWLVGANENVVFDEAHFGIAERSGVATLMRKYRLHGLGAGLILLAGLFIWRNATSLAPSRAAERREGFVTGKGSGAGFVNLLRRSVAPRDLLATCYDEWKKSVAPALKFSPTRSQEAERIFQAENRLPNKERNPIAAYKNIAQALGARNKKQ
jgi:hypothetical protein